MTTTTINPSANSGYVRSQNASYPTTQSGSGLVTSTTNHTIGQQFNSGASLYFIWESLLDFDTSAIPAGATINSVTLKLWGASDSSDTDATLEARLYDYGTSITTADWLATTSLSSHTRLATFNTSGWTLAAFNTFTEDGTNFRTNLNSGGITRIVLVSDRAVAGTTPTGNEFVAAVSHVDANSAHWPQLIVDYSTVTTSTRTVSPSVGFKATPSRTVSPTTGLTATNARTVAPATGFKATLTRAVASSALLQAVRTIASSVLLSRSLVRQITPSLLLTYHTLTPLHGATITSGATSATGMAASDAVTSDDANNASLSGAVHAVMIGAGSSNARFS